MKIREIVGDYTVLAHGEVFVFDRNDIILDWNDSNTKITIKFQDSPGRKGFLSFKTSGSELTIILKIFGVETEKKGVYLPIHLGKLKNGKTLALSFVIENIDSEEGNLLFKYTFWIK